MYEVTFCNRQYKQFSLRETVASLWSLDFKSKGEGQKIAFGKIAFHTIFILTKCTFICCYCKGGSGQQWRNIEPTLEKILRYSDLQNPHLKKKKKKDVALVCECK